MEYRLKYLLILLYFIPFSLQANSIEDGFGINASYNLFYINSDGISSFINACDCYEFTGSEDSFTISALYNTRYKSNISFSLVLNYNNLNIDNTFNYQLLAKKGIDTANVPVNGVFESSFSFIGPEVNMNYRFLDQFIVFTGAGFYFPLSAVYNYKEEIVKPSDYYFENGLQERNNQEGDLKKVNSLNFYIPFGLSYNISLLKGKTLAINISTSYNFYINSLINESSWNYSSLNLALGIEYRLPQYLSTPLKPGNLR